MGQFCSQGHKQNKLGRGLLINVTYQILKLYMDISYPEYEWAMEMGQWPIHLHAKIKFLMGHLNCDGLFGKNDGPKKP